MGATHNWQGRKLQQQLLANVRKSLDQAAVLVQQSTTASMRSGGRMKPSPKGRAPAVQSGTLRRSIQIDRSRISRLIVRIGTNIKYGRIQELGGTIAVRKAKYLTIPISYEAKRASESGQPARQRFPNAFVFRSGGKLLLATSERGKLTVHYKLQKSVTLPFRPYLKPALRRTRSKIMGLFKPAVLMAGIK